MQPQMSITKMIPVSTREEATGTPVGCLVFWLQIIIKKCKSFV